MDETARRLQVRAMIGRRFWYSTDFWGIFLAIPVTIVAINSKGELVAIGELGDNLIHEFRIQDHTELFNTETEANNEACRMNQQVVAGDANA